MTGRLATFRALTRPVTLIPVFIIASAFGFAGAVSAHMYPDVPLILLAGALLVVANGASNMVNEIGDQVEDSVNPYKSARPVVSGAVDAMHILSAVLVSWLVAVMVSVLFMPRMFTVLYILIILFAFLYSYPPRLKKRFGINYLAIATPRGALGIAAAFVVQGSIYSHTLWFMLAVTAPFVFMANETRNIDDREADLYAGVQTVSTLYGERAGRWLSLAGFVYPLPVILATGLWVHFPYLFLLVLPTLFVSINIFRWPGRRLWVSFYGYFALLALLLSLSVVFG